MIIRFDIDRFREILDTITRNRGRSVLTGFGVFWGVFMLVALIGGGKGLKQMLQNVFAGFATNTAIVFPNNTTKPYHGFRKGRSWTLDYKDVERIKAQVPELEIVTPMVTSWGAVATADDKRFSGSLKGVHPDYGKVEEPQLKHGRYINDMDMRYGRKVCVIGKKVSSTLFPNVNDPCGRYIRVDSIYYRVVGLDMSEGNVSVNGNASEAILIPITVYQSAYNRGQQVDLICATGHKGVVISNITPKIRSVVARAHDIDPTDEKGLVVLNTEVMFGMLDNLFRGVNLLIWLVGIGTLLAGAIGVSNIMMVTVRERTTEIGIRRAIGATPQAILGQIICESLVLTLVAGMGGIVFAVAILQLLETAVATDGVVTTQWQVGFWTAVGAALLICLLGVLAGLAPAARAMGVKPVDAMRDE